MVDTEHSRITIFDIGFITMLEQHDVAMGCLRIYHVLSPLNVVRHIVKPDKVVVVDSVELEEMLSLVGMGRVLHRRSKSPYAAQDMIHQMWYEVLHHNIRTTIEHPKNLTFMAGSPA
jgi:hypothetical protein